MVKIGLLSDTHAFLSDNIFTFFDNVDEIWHAGDIGNIGVADKLAAFKPLRAVFGNIDGHDVRIVHPMHQKFIIENFKVWITHIGGYPGRYDNLIKAELFRSPPDIFICGHSHILKVIYDKKLNFLHINPGAFGLSGFHTVRTALRFTLDNKNIKDLEILEVKKHN